MNFSVFSSVQEATPNDEPYSRRRKTPLLWSEGYKKNLQKKENDASAADASHMATRALKTELFFQDICWRKETVVEMSRGEGEEGCLVQN